MSITARVFSSSFTAVCSSSTVGHSRRDPALMRGNNQEKKVKEGIEMRRSALCTSYITVSSQFTGKKNIMKISVICESV